jgi:hypothetical protein
VARESQDDGWRHCSLLRVWLLKVQCTLLSHSFRFGRVLPSTCRLPLDTMGGLYVDVCHPGVTYRSKLSYIGCDTVLNRVPTPWLSGWVSIEIYPCYVLVWSVLLAERDHEYGFFESNFLVN